MSYAEQVLQSPTPERPNADPAARLLSAFQHYQNDSGSEHHVARFAILLLMKIFDMEQWNLVPQPYTLYKRWPDLVMEEFTVRPGKNRKNVFVAKIYIEFKTEVNPKDPLAQVLEAIQCQTGRRWPSKGIVIAIKGSQWIIHDYQIVQQPVENCPGVYKKVLTHLDFYDERIIGLQGRTPPSKAYYDNLAMDITKKAEYQDLIEALTHIAIGGPARDLTPLLYHATGIPNSITTSTIGSVTNTREIEEDKEFELADGFLEEFGYLAEPFF